MADTEAAVAEETPDSTPDKQEKSSGTDVAVRQSADLVQAEDDFFEGAGTGLDDFGQGDFLVPYVRIIQALSKELQRGHQKYIQGAQVGQFINSATKKLYDGEKGIDVIPVHYSRRYQSWKPNNGGPAQDYGDDSTVYDSTQPNAEGKRVDAAGNEVTASGQYFVLIVDRETGDFEVAVLSFGGVQQKKSRQWNSQIAARRERHPVTGKSVAPAMYFYSYHITTVPESNDKGQWYGYSITEGPKVMDLPNGREIFLYAKQVREQVTGGELRAAPEEEPHDPVGDEGGEEQAF